MTTNQNFKPSEGKREEFRKYLEKNGIMDALTKVLVNLYEEVDKPEDALQYILDKLSLQAGLETQLQLSNKLEEAKNQIKTLETELEELKNKDVIEKQDETVQEADEVPPPPPVEETEAPTPAEETAEQ